jgi:hypothetical protein
MPQKKPKASGRPLAAQVDDEPAWRKEWKAQENNPFTLCDDDILSNYGGDSEYGEEETKFEPPSFQPTGAAPGPTRTSLHLGTPVDGRREVRLN